MTKYWTYGTAVETLEAEFKTKEEAEEHAQTRFEEQCEDEGIKHTLCEDLTLIQFSYDDQGETVIHKKEASALEFEYYRGDIKEHGTF